MQDTNQTSPPIPPAPVVNNIVAVNTKSFVVAGVLALTLGAFGAHDFYLRKWKFAVLHIVLLVAPYLILAICSAFFAATFAWNGLSNFLILTVSLSIIIGICGVGNIIWAIVEGIIILVRGRQGLLEQGYAVKDVDGSILVPTPNTPFPSASNDVNSNNNNINPTKGENNGQCHR